MKPVTKEDEWLDYLENIPRWSPPQIKTLVLSPHPDDETLGAGGLITDLRRNNIEVIILAITDGENAYPNMPHLRQIRISEQKKALGKLGISKNNIIRFSLEDSHIQSKQHQLEQLLESFIRGPTHIVAPWSGDFHPDHEIVGKIATKIAQKKNVLLSSYFFWTWHYATVSYIKQLPLRIYPLSITSLNLKMAALSCYRSQQKYFKHKTILPKILLKPAFRSFEVYCPYNYQTTFG